MARRERHTTLLDAMSPGLQGQIIMEMNQVWIAKVPFLENVMTEACDSELGSFHYAFLTEVASNMESAIYAETEVFGARHILYILTTGKVLGRRLLPLTGKLKEEERCAGSVWGTDFMLADGSLQHCPEVQAVTYVENLILRYEDFMGMVMAHSRTCRGLRRHLRWYTNWLAFQREIMREARRRIIVKGFIRATVRATVMEPPKPPQMYDPDPPFQRENRSFWNRSTRLFGSRMSTRGSRVNPGFNVVPASTDRSVHSVMHSDASHFSYGTTRGSAS